MWPGDEDYFQPGEFNTPSELADQMHAMFTWKGAMLGNNPIYEAIYRKQHAFVESEKTLVVLDSEIGAVPEVFLEKVLNNLQHKNTIKYMHLRYPNPGDDVEEQIPFDFKKFSEQLRIHLPMVELLYIMYMPIKNFKLQSETIKSLQLLQPEFKDDIWEIDLPNLEDLDMQHLVPPGMIHFGFITVQTLLEETNQ